MREKEKDGEKREDLQIDSEDEEEKYDGGLSGEEKAVESRHDDDDEARFDCGLWKGHTRAHG